MFFSVLIPVYNVEKYLITCIESVLSQDEKDYEIVLVDDGSTDSSGKICDEYAEKYSSVIRVIHKENEGLLLTRRRAIKEAQGDYFVHLDSDDYLLPNALSDIKQALIKNSADMAIIKITYGQLNKNDEFVSRLPFSDGQIFEADNKKLLYRQQLLGGFMTSLVQKIAHRSIVNIDSDYDRYRGIVSNAEDHLQSLPLLYNCKKAVFLDKAYYYYRYNGQSITKKVSLDNLLKGIISVKTVFQQETEYYEKYSFSNIEISIVSAKHINSIGRRLFEAFSAVDNKQDKEKLLNFSKQLSKDDFVKTLWKKSDKNIVSKTVKIGFRLIYLRQIRLFYSFIKYLNKRSTKNK
jgi:glycosyltransferase involved in cell wall biosynthesis